MSLSRSGEPVESSESRTKQAHKAECDVNNIVARYKKTGHLASVNRAVPVFADVSEVGDFRTALETVRSAEDYFMSLPPRVRELFGNDAVAFLAEVQDPESAAMKEAAKVVRGERRKPRQDRREGDPKGPGAPAPGSEPPAPSGGA